MNKGYKGGCFSLKVPPVFCNNGNLLLIPKGRDNEIYVYDTLGNGESKSQFSASKEIITGLGVIKSDQNEEFIVTTTVSGLIRIFHLNDILNHKEKKSVIEIEIGRCIIDLKVAKNNIYFIISEAKDQDTLIDTNVSLYKIPISDIISKFNTSVNQKSNHSKFIQKSLKKIINFSYGALNFQVSSDESLFCFIWKNILIIWNTQYPDKIIRFRHSEYILSLTLSEDQQFVATGDAYGRTGEVPIL